MPEQPASQAAEPFEEPPREEIPGISRGHVAYMESTDAEEAWRPDTDSPALRR